VTLALPDTSRFLYISLSGENCSINNIFVKVTDEEVGPGSILRIAEELNYINDQPVGDIPNLQVDNWCSDSTQGIPVEDGLTIKFHAKSLPTARLVWQCPFIRLFSSEKGRVDGGDLRDYLLLMMDGESREYKDNAESEVSIDHTPDFNEWKEWMASNKEGMDFTVKILRDNNRIIMDADNKCFKIHSVTILEDPKGAYVAITGDQTAVTNIKILRED